MTHSIRPQPGILDIAPYQGGESRIPGRSDVLKLSSNENAWGPSPAAKAALVASAEQLHRYPPTDQTSLRGAIGEVHGLDPERIVCGAGSDELIALLCQAYAGPGDEVAYTQHGFSMYRISALAAGALPVCAPERDRTVDVDALLGACGDATRLVFVTNPGNPTGTMLAAAEIERLASALPEQALLVLDGAYAEFAELYDGGASLVAARDNVVMTRTFSKLYGLGGLRIGWAYAPAHVIDVLNRVRGPFNLSQSQLAAAEAAVRDAPWVEFCASETRRLRERLTDGLRSLGIGCDKSHANFVLARFAGADEAEAADRHLRGQGIIVRRVAGYGLPAALRITVGDEPSCERVLNALAEFRALAA